MHCNPSSICSEDWPLMSQSPSRQQRPDIACRGKKEEGKTGMVSSQDEGGSAAAMGV